MATHSSTLAWRIPWTEEPGRLQSMGLQSVRHNCVTNFHFQRTLNSLLLLQSLLTANIAANIFIYLFIYLFISAFFSFIYISWRLITSQYCSGFCHTLT